MQAREVSFLSPSHLLSIAAETASDLLMKINVFASENK